jgi:protein CWC15
LPCADEDEDDDDTAALLAELEKIQAQRAEEAARKAVERAQAEHVERAAELAGGNPLLNLGGGGGGGGGVPDFGVKRSWHEDSVFKHQARGEPPAKKQFVNDTLRSDFHKRFLNRYIK